MQSFPPFCHVQVILKDKAKHTLPPMEVENGCISNISFLSFREIFH